MRVERSRAAGAAVSERKPVKPSRGARAGRMGVCGYPLDAWRGGRDARRATLLPSQSCVRRGDAAGFKPRHSPFCMRIRPGAILGPLPDAAPPCFAASFFFKSKSLIIVKVLK